MRHCARWICELRMLPGLDDCRRGWSGRCANGSSQPVRRHHQEDEALFSWIVFWVIAASRWPSECPSVEEAFVPRAAAVRQPVRQHRRTGWLGRLLGKAHWTGEGDAVALLIICLALVLIWSIVVQRPANKVRSPALTEPSRTSEAGQNGLFNVGPQVELRPP